MTKRQQLTYLLIALFALACYFPLFLHLDHMSVRLWDEARRAVNAFEMAQNGNLLVTHYDGAPEMWGTKPPFLIWCQAFFMKTIGYNEIALRLPSALAALATVTALILFCWKVLKRPVAGFLAGLVLLTAKGYIGAHVARSGDFDSMLTLWETCYLLSFFTFFSHADLRKKRKWLFITAGFIAMASLTKGIAGFLFMPGILLFVLVFGVAQPFAPAMGEHRSVPNTFLQFLSWKNTWLAALLAIGPILAFYGLREMANPGYVAAVLDNEVGGRYLVTQGGHLHPWYHYFHWLHREHFVPWLFFIPLGLLVGFWQKGKLRYLTWLLVIGSLSFLFILSFGQTRIMWYMAPVYPSLALLVGLGLERLVAGASLVLSRQPSGGSRCVDVNFGILAVFIIGLFWQPYGQIMERVYQEQHPSWDWPELKYRDFMRQIRGTKDYTIVHGKYNSHVVFYKKVHNLDRANIRSQAMRDFDENKFRFGEGPLEFQAGEKLVVCENKVHAALNQVYTVRVLWEWDTCKLMEVTGKVGE